MKRVFSILFVLLLSLSLAGCGQHENIYTVSKNGKNFQINRLEKTISEGNYTYHYKLTGTDSSFNVTITYPNGSTYWYNQSGMTGQGGWSDDYAEDAYTSGDILVDVLQEQVPASANPGKIIGAISVIALGLLYSVFPNVFWYLRYGWRYKDAEPSDAALILARIGGIIAVVIGIVLLIH